MDAGDDGPPRCDLRVRPDSGHVVVARGGGGDEGSFGDDEGTRRGGPLSSVSWQALSAEKKYKHEWR